MAVKRVAVFIFALLLPAQAISAEKNLDLTLGWRTDSLRWNIADTDGAPDILSELTWKDLTILDHRVRGDYTAENGWYVRGAASLGLILDGENQDSDYNGNGRTSEFSRSNNSTDGDYVFDFSGAFGYRFTIAQDEAQRSLFLTPLLGYSYHEQYLRITNGNQTIPATGPFPGLDSTYWAQWKGPWIGVELLGERIVQNANIFLLVEYHRADYYAEADWNLRSDFQHPKSFEHQADGKGTLISAGVFSARRPGWGMRFTLDYQSWRTDPGTQRYFFASGATPVTRLNEVVWRSASINFGLHRAF